MCEQLRRIYSTGIQSKKENSKGTAPRKRDYTGTASTKEKQQEQHFHSKLSAVGKPASGARALDASQLGVIVAPVGVVPVQGAPPRAALVPRAAPRQDQSKDNDDDEQQHAAASVDVFHRQDENASR